MNGEQQDRGRFYDSSASPQDRFCVPSVYNDDRFQRAANAYERDARLREEGESQ